WRMRCLASSATAMLTPASEYFMAIGSVFWMGERRAQLSRAVSRRAESGKSRRPRITRNVRYPQNSSRTGGRLRGTAGPGVGDSERPEKSSPPDTPRMDEHAGVREKTRAVLAGLPGIGRRIQGHVNQHGRTDDVAARNATPEAAVIGILAIVAHHEITFVRNAVGDLYVGGSDALRPAERVVFFEAFAVDPDGAVVNIHGIPGQADDALDVVGRSGIERRLKNDDLLALGIAPQRNVKIGEGDACIVAEAAHDEVIADEQRVLHGAGGNHARLTDGAVDQQKHQPDPEPRDDFAAHLLLRGELLFYWFLFPSLCFPRLHNSPTMPTSIVPPRRRIRKTRNRGGVLQNV